MKNKDNKMLIYKIFKPILGPIYKFYYNPKIIGAENIPEEGAILVVGNHVHIMDQCNVIIATKRCIHYMAKKEYFDSKKTCWFFKSVGCIPVNRKIHDDSAKTAALEVLRDKHALGLFPEGTRNGLKEEYIKELYAKYFNNVDYKSYYELIKNNKTSQVNYLEKLLEEKVITKKEFLTNVYETDRFLKQLIKNKKITEKDYYNNILLPFKFGAVSMAQKTDAYLVPFAITGTYKFRSKDLVVRIGKPFKVAEDDDLEKANKKLEKTIRDLIINKS